MSHKLSHNRGHGHGKPDHDADVGDDLNVFIYLDIVPGQFVDYQVNGNDDDADVLVTFRDEAGHTVSEPHHFNGSYRVDLSAMDYNSLITASIVATDDNGNVAIGQGDSFMLVPF
jgi:hypothetical protein